MEVGVPGQHGFSLPMQKKVSQTHVEISVSKKEPESVTHLTLGMVVMNV